MRKFIITQCVVGSMEYCYACGAESKKGKRRLLGSPGTQHVLPLLCDTAKRAMAETSDNVQLDEAKVSTGYVCRPCFRDMERLRKLQEEVRTVRERLYTNAKNAVSYLPVQLASQSTSVLLTDETQENSSCEEERCSTSELGQKRSLSPPQQGLLKKRRLQMSKIRQAPVVAGSNTSPAVTVSYLSYLIY